MRGGLTYLPGQGAHNLTNMGVRADMGDTPLPAPSSFSPVSCLTHTETHTHTDTHRNTHIDTQTHTQTHTHTNRHRDTHTKTHTHRHTPIGAHTHSHGVLIPLPRSPPQRWGNCARGPGQREGSGLLADHGRGPPQCVRRGKRLLCVQRGQMASATAPTTERLAICTRPSCQLCHPGHAGPARPQQPPSPGRL